MIWVSRPNSVFCEQCHVPTNQANRLSVGGQIMTVCKACWVRIDKFQNLKPYASIPLRPARDIREE